MAPQPSDRNCAVIDIAHGDTLQRVTEILHKGGTVALPTETVYGLAADVAQDDAILRVFKAKNRPANHPLIVHLDEPDRVDEYATHIPSIAREAMRLFWPGPLTILLQRTEAISNLVTGGRNSVALRCPANEFFRDVVRALDSGLVAPSANRFGHVSPTRASHVFDDLADRIDLIVDGGETIHGVESTIIDFTTSIPQLLRAGALPRERISELLDIELLEANGPSRAPGMLESHYAPRSRVQLVDSALAATELEESLRRAGHRVRVLEHSDNEALYAATLYAQLRRADADAIEIVVAVVPKQLGLGAAIADRLNKAAVKPYD